ncbi:hypothetical protein POV05_22420 [Klebsiella quasipneumoniae]|uniref:hypothetical protein n=1 Tax=Klebsiella pneumoniae complex TaxID=3390273 RepID=UPI001CF6361F|nr:hypothetical protein [Klebsiella variicola]MCB3511131.1 hypothetical protein [Klebsiella variicola]HCI7050260.1 hypothetical protein [Klebsiella quasipneumoniae subsp. similipneumoniae]
MSYSIVPQSDFEYTFQEEVYQATPVQIGESRKVADPRFKEDTETWEYEFRASLVDGSTVKWIVTVEVGYSLTHDVSSSGVLGVPEEIEVEHDPEFECHSEDDDDY